MTAHDRRIVAERAAQAGADVAAASFRRPLEVETKTGPADLVTVAGTWYSSRGVEMKVYAPTSDPLLLVAGADDVDALADVSDPADRSEDVG